MQNKEWNSAEKSFKVLSFHEEELLSVPEKRQYYEKLRKWVLKRPLATTTKGARTIAPKLFRITQKIAVGVTHAFTNANVDWICDGKENIPQGPAIFAHSHGGILDGFVWIPHMDRHCIILHGAEVNKLLLLCQVNTGLILVKKGNKANNQNAKLDMIRLLLEGHSVTYFPEGAWNLSPNKLLLPLSFGFLDTARKANVPVVPVVHEYTYDTSEEKEKIVKIHLRFGKAIYVTEKDDLEEKLQEYKEIMGTIRWELIEEKGLYQRKSITNWDYINFVKGNIKNLELGKISIDRERKYLFDSGDDFYKFHHINDIPWDDTGAFLETKEVQKLKLINREKLREKR